MKSLKNIKDNALLICANQDKLQILNYLSDNSIFLNLEFYDSHFSYLSFNKNYLFYLRKNYQIKPYLGERFKKYFDYVDNDKEYKSDKIKELQKIKKSLLKNNILFEKQRYYSQIYQVNDLFVPKRFNQNVEKIYTNRITENKVTLYKAIDQLEQVRFVYEKVVKLLENGIDINKINILNSTVEDDVSLGKLFHDSFIPYNINKRTSLSEYPVMINLIKHLKETGYEKALNYLNELEKNDVINKIIRVFNTYEKVLFVEDIEVIIYELKKLSLIDSGYAEAINITSFNNHVYREDEYYILMNYYDDAFPKKYVDNDYLSDSEVKEIDYPTSVELNNYNKQMITDVLNQINHLILVYPNQVIDETRPARFNLSREINYFNFEHEYKVKTYLNDLVYLDFAKKRYDFDNYNIYTADLERLNNVYHHEYQEYIPFFTGINDKTLTYLIDKFNTLTAYKLESYALCPFQYYLKYLLKLDSFEDNIFTYIGNVIHKALELKMKNGRYDNEELFASYNFPEKENYKRAIFEEIIVENLEVIEAIVSDFESNSLFKSVLAEEKINQAFDEYFKLTGVIDKVLIDDEYKYFLIIDYKLSDKDFKRDDLTKKYRLQLPFYLYSFKKTHPDLRPTGMLYQKTSLVKEDRLANNSYKMKGMVLDDVSIIGRIDPDFSRIQGVRLKKDETLSDSPNNLINSEDLEKLLSRTETVISETSKSIVKGDFTIKPILVDVDARSKNSISCEYCNYSSICYSKNKMLGGE